MRILVALVALYALRVVLAHVLGPWVEARERAKLEALVGPLDPESFAESPLRDDDNAVPAIRKAIAELDLKDGRWPSVGDPAYLPTGVDPEALDERLATQAAALDRLAEAATRPLSSFGRFPEASRTVESGEGIAWLRASRLVLLDGSRALDAGDAERLDRALATLHGLARVLRRSPVATRMLLGVAVERLFLDLLRAAIPSPRSTSFLERAKSRVDELESLPGPVEFVRFETGNLLFRIDRLLDEEPWVSQAALRERVGSALCPWSHGHDVARLLEVRRRIATLATIPRARWPGDLDLNESPERRLRAWLDPTVPHNNWSPGVGSSTTIDAIRRFQALATSEQVAALAVELATAARSGAGYPETLDSTPAGRGPSTLTGGLPTLERDRDGTVRLKLLEDRRLSLERIQALEEPSPSTRAPTTEMARLKSATYLEHEAVGGIVALDAHEDRFPSDGVSVRSLARDARLLIWPLPPENASAEIP